MLISNVLIKIHNMNVNEPNRTHSAYTFRVHIYKLINHVNVYTIRTYMIIKKIQQFCSTKWRFTICFNELPFCSVRVYFSPFCYHFFFFFFVVLFYFALCVRMLCGLFIYVFFFIVVVIIVVCVHFAHIVSQFICCLSFGCFVCAQWINFINSNTNRKFVSIEWLFISYSTIFWWIILFSLFAFVFFRFYSKSLPTVPIANRVFDWKILWIFNLINLEKKNASAETLNESNEVHWKASGKPSQMQIWMIVIAFWVLCAHYFFFTTYIAI